MHKYSTLKILIIAFLLNCYSNELYAASESYIQTLSGTIKKGDSCIVIDDKFLNLSLENWNKINHLSVDNLISFELRNDTPVNFRTRAFSCTLKISIYYFSSREQDKPTEINDISLVVKYDSAKGAYYPATGQYKFKNAFKVIVVINSIESKEWGEKLPSVFRLKNQIFVERKYPFNPQLQGSIKAIFSKNYDKNDNNAAERVSTVVGGTNKMNISWDIADFTLFSLYDEYDVEWTYVDQQSARGNYISTHISTDVIEATQAALMMQNDNTRVTVQSGPYTINLPYQEGYILVRVRGVYYKPITNLRLTTDWLYGDVNTPDEAVIFTITNAHEKYLNWQYTASFAEEGKRKEVISYFDATLRTRQMVTVPNSDNNAIIGETIYDNMGRAAVNILPAPTDGNIFQYYLGFNKNIASIPYSSTDITNNVSTGVCSVIAGRLNTDFGTSKYYSPNNFVLGNPANYPNYYFTKYVPDAKEYPFSQTEYTKDNTGRVRKQGGVGQEFQIGSGHETQYFYGKPMQKELDRMFGMEAGSASHYLKNMVVDPNGQVSVSYIDANGKTIATALAGNTPQNLEPLKSSNDASVTLNQTLIESQDFNRDASKLQLQATSTFTAAVPGNFTLTYSITPEKLAYTNFHNGDPFCVNCYYDITIEIKDECGFLVYTKTTNPISGSDLSCHDAGFSIIPETANFSVSKIGEYYVTYTIQLSKAQIQNKEDYYIGNSTEVSKLNDFFIDELNKLVFDGCYSDCKTCEAKLVSETAFSEKMSGLIHDLAIKKYSGKVFNPDAPEITDPNTGWIHNTYTTLLAACSTAQADCIKSPCQVKLEMLVNDVLPDGQYAKYTPITYTIPNNASAPGGGIDEAVVSILKKVYDLLPISEFSNFEFTKNGQKYNLNSPNVTTLLTRAEFIEQYTLHHEWAVQDDPTDATHKKKIGFVTYHPEYCSYQWCIATTTNEYPIPPTLNEASYIFDEEIKNMKGAEAASPSKKYFKRAVWGAAADDYLSLLNKDPFFTNGGKGIAYYNLIKNDLEQLSEVINIKVIDIIATEANCNTLTPLVGCPIFEHSKNALDLVDWILYCKPETVSYSTDATVQRNQALALANSWSNCSGPSNASCRTINREWIMFRDYYLKIKMKYVRLAKQDYFTSLSKTCENCYIGTDGLNNIPAAIQSCMNNPSPSPYNLTISLPLSNCSVGYDVEYKSKNRIFNDYINEDLFIQCTKKVTEIQQSGKTAAQIIADIQAQQALDLAQMKAQIKLNTVMPMKQNWLNRLRAVVTEENEKDILNGIAIPRFNILSDVSGSPCTTITNIVADLEAVVNKFIDIATDIKDIRIVSVLPSGVTATSHNFNSFKDVFTYHLGLITPSNTYSLGFNENLLSQPYPYNKIPFAISPNITQIDATICHNIEVLRRNWNGTTPATFHLYLKSELKEDYLLTEAQLTELMQKCDNNCKLLDEAIHIPVAFASPPIDNPNHPFIDCEKLTTLVTQFNETFWQIQRPSKLYSVSLENYLNHTLGYSLAFYEYDNFLKQCPGYSEHPLNGVLYNKPGQPILPLDEDVCIKNGLASVFEQAGIKYDAHIKIKREEFRNKYTSTCLGTKPKADLSGNVMEYHYTLYYYDQSGNLVKTVPPEGVKLLNDAELQQVADIRQSNNAICNVTSLPTQNNQATSSNILFNELNNNSAKAIEMWVHNESSNSRQVVFIAENAANHYFWVNATLQDGQIWVEFYKRTFLPPPSHASTYIRLNKTYATIPSNIALQNWNHIFVQVQDPSVNSLISGNDLEIYLDGIKLTAVNYPNPAPPNISVELPLGPPANNLNELSHLRVYKSCATFAEIANNYKNGCLRPVDRLSIPYGSIAGSNVDNSPLSLWEHWQYDPNAYGAGDGGAITNTNNEFANRFIVPDHTLATNYYYNSLNQVVKQNTPDAGESRFWYDKLGRLAISQNAEQKSPVRESDNNPANRYSYTRYDALGRIVEVGEKIGVNDENYYPNENRVREDNAYIDENGNPYDYTGWLDYWYNSVGAVRQVTVTAYDDAENILSSWNVTGLNPLQNIRKRVAATAILSEGNDPTNISTRTASSYYSYDISGNVNLLIQENAQLIKYEKIYLPGDGLKRIQYEYDLISGKVNKVKYQDGKYDQFYYQYLYDADNRLTDVYTSRNNDPNDVYGIPSTWKKEAKYRYYLHGPLARMELGNDGVSYSNTQVQGVDYAYTLQGWIKGVNGQFLGNATNGGNADMSGDGWNDVIDDHLNPFTNFGRDAIAYSLGYYTGDYQPIGLNGSAAGSLPTMAFTKQYNAPAVSVANVTGKSLYNGNISHSTYAIKNLEEDITVGYTYQYDQLNRLLAMNRHGSMSNKIENNVSQWSNSSIIEAYAERVSYDANGNILTYKRNGASQPGVGLPNEMDELEYSYNRDSKNRLLNNKLNFVNDPTGASNYAKDIDNQETGNYTYDAIGNLIADNAEKLTQINWTVYGKIQSIDREGFGRQINYDYDVSGNRINKFFSSYNGNKVTFYVRDAQGNTMGVYNYNSYPSWGYSEFKWQEQTLYGSSRLGMVEPNITIKSSEPLPDDLYENFEKNYSGGDPMANTNIGNRRYELTNHLGNVLATISDILVYDPNDGSPQADIVTAQDYYPFGMTMPGREYYASGKYRYGFNGKENDKDISEGDLDFGVRIYDSRIGRWLAVDPKASKLASQSPYDFCLNSPILFIDPDGAYPVVTITKQKTGKTTLQRVIGYTGTKTQYTKVNLYKVTVTDTEDKNFKMEFSVTRDAFAVKKGDVANGQMKMTNVAFEPKDENINHYTGKAMEYPKGDGTKALKLTQYESEVVHAESNQASVDLGYRKQADVASGVMIHVGGEYQHSNGTTSCAASEGCFGVTDGNSSASNPSNSYSNDALNKVISQANKSKTNKGKIEIIVEKRKASERQQTKTQKQS